MIIGLTGSIGVGKSNVVKIFEEYNIPQIDADLLAKDLLNVNHPCYLETLSHFGESILNPDKTVNRFLLGNIVFNDKSKLNILNSIFDNHYSIEFNKQLLSFKDEPFLVYNAALIIENKNTLCDKLIVVHCEKDQQIQRVMKRGFTEEQALDRIKAQLSSEEKLKRADYSINTSFSKEETKSQTIAIMKKLGIIPTNQ